MKVFYYLIPILMITGCKTQTESVKTSQQTKMEQLKDKSICPSDGTCSIKVHQNSKLKIDEDDIGEIYPVIMKGQNIVVEYTYLTTGPEGTADGNYSETIHFEIPSDVKNLNKESAALAEVNLLFGKHCFCPGEAGYYPVTDGKISVVNSGNTLTFDLTFSQDKTSHKISRIVESVKID